MTRYGLEVTFSEALYFLTEKLIPSVICGVSHLEASQAANNEAPER